MEGIEFWRSKDGERINAFPYDQGFLDLSWAPDHQRLAAVHEIVGVVVWNRTGATAFRKLLNSKRAICAAWSPDGQLLACAGFDGNIALHDTTTWETRDTLIGHTNAVTGLVWSPDGHYLASCSQDSSIRLWTVESGVDVRVLEGHSASVRDIAWSSDGRLLASASEDQTTRLWEVHSGRQASVLEGHTEPVNGVSFASGDHLLAANSENGRVLIWRTDTLEAVGSLQFSRMSCQLSKLSFHPTAPVLGVESDGVIGLWDLDLNVLLASSDQPSSTVYYSNAKVVLLGDSGVGKSGLGLVLTGSPFVPTESTHGRRVWTLTSIDSHSTTERIRETREVLLWDLAGQPGYRLIHQLHLWEVAVAIVVFDSRSETDPFAGVNYWNRALRQISMLQGNAAPPLKKILVEARTDRGGISVNAERIRALAKSLGFANYIQTSAKDGRGIAELLDAIHQAIDWRELPRISSTDLFLEIKAFLISEKEAGRLLSSVDDLFRAYIEAHNKHTEAKTLRSRFEVCIGRVEASGLIERLNFGDLILLQPEILDGYAAAIVNAAKEEPDGFGCINEEIVLTGRFRLPVDSRLRDPEQERLLLLSTVEALLRHEIAFREQSPLGTLLVFPSQLTRENPDLPDPEGKTLLFDFQGPVSMIYATLAVRLSRSGKFKGKEMWKNAVSFTSDEGGIYGVFLRELEEGRGQLSVFFGDDFAESAKSQFEAYVHAHLLRRAIPGTVRVQRVVVCPNPTCKTPVAEIVVQKRLQRGHFTVDCPVCGTEISLVEKRFDIDSLLLHEIDYAADSKRDLETAASIVEGKIATRDFDLLIVYNRADRAFVLQTAEKLKERGILPWLDEWQTEPGTSWFQTLERDLNQIKSVAIFLGQQSKRERQDRERASYIRHFLKRSRPVIPVILPSIQRGGIPDSLKNLQFVDFRKKEPDPFKVFLSILRREHYGATSRRSVVGQASSEKLDRTEERTLKQKLDSALAREDWLAGKQHYLELARLASGNNEPKEAFNLGLLALNLVDDTRRLNGKGLREPLEIMVKHATKEQLLESLRNCNHRAEIVSELRALATESNELWAIVKALGISPWRRWFESSTPDPSVIDSLPKHGDGFPALRLLRVRLENIKTFKNLLLDFRGKDAALDRCIAIVGENANGKTTLLQAIALGALGPDIANQQPLLARDFLRKGVDRGCVELEFELSVDANASEHEKISISIGLEMVAGEAACRSLPHTQMVFGNFNHAEHLIALRNKLDYNWGICCGYGAFRGLRQSVEKLSSPYRGRLELERVLSLFQPQSSLMEPETLEALLRTDVSTISKGRPNIPLGLRDEILKVFSNVIPGLEVEEDGGQALLIDKWDGIRSLGLLSDGYNSMAGLIGHLIRHTLEVLGWFEEADKNQADKLLSPLSAVGIVLIDEVDLHLHPIWQRHILYQLQSAFPNIQFIVSTHSPLVLGGTPDVRVIVLRRTESQGIEAVSDLPSILGWRVDQLLTALPFAVSSAYDPYTERLAVKYGRLLSELGPDDPEVLAIEKELDELGHLGPGSTPLDRRAWEFVNEFADYRLAQMSSDERQQILARVWRMLKE